MADSSVETFRAELRSEPEPRKPTLTEVQHQIHRSEPTIARLEAAKAEPQRPVTLAEIGAQMASQPALVPKADTPAAALRPETPVFAPKAEAAPVAGWKREAPGEPLDEQPRTSEPQPAEHHPDIEISEDELSELDGQEPLQQAEPTAAGGAPAAGRPAIVSEHVGRQVAAAFGELSEAFAARSRKSLDEMAEEMLRPMLQDWLDNNLPTLVERLVREEIERVARGAGG
jgi:cell pole-organizing protein PopZ